MRSNGNLYLFLDQLRFGETPELRNQAIRELIVLEEAGEIAKKDFFALLEDEDPVFQNYAVGAIGRQQIQESNSKLKSLFLKTNNPMILVTLIQTFEKLNTTDFVDILLKRLGPKSLKFRIRPPKKHNLNDIFDQEFIFDQIIVPTLNYFKICGTGKVKRLVTKYLKHKDPLVRWHALEVFKYLKFEISKVDLQQIAENDNNHLNREQANIMLKLLQ